MYDNSSLTQYGGCFINDLYLYDNATVSLFGGDITSKLYIDPANTGMVKLYADFDRFEPFGPYGEGRVRGTWLAGGSLNIHIVGNGAYSHIQFIPEPATIAILALGSLIVFNRRRR
jgi:hypothetical protein